MQVTPLPGTDLSVSRLVFGCWGITSDFHWGERDEKEALATIDAALDAGVNCFDTAEMYADGASEELVGRALAGRRDRVLLATKVALRSMHPRDVAEACERSLRRLGTDRIDLYQTHWFQDRSIPPAETWGALVRLREDGKVRALGVCNAGTGDLAEVCGVSVPSTDQLPYSLLWRAIERSILPDCRGRGIGVLAYSPLLHGLLTGRYRDAGDVPEGRARSRHFSATRKLTRHGEPGCERETFAAIDAVRRVADGLGHTMADVALAWVAAQPGVTAVIAGARTPAQLAANAAALERPLPEDALAALDRATRPLMERLGPNPDMWQGERESRFR